MTKKIEYIIISFYTEGLPYDKGINLKEEAKEFYSISKVFFDKVLLFNPRKLIELNPKWNKILSDKNVLEDHINSKQPNSTKNNNWANLNFSLWKPYLIDEIINREEIAEDSIILFHDININKYEQYKYNLKSKKYLKKLMGNKSILFFKDVFFPLSEDCKQELIRKYLGNEGNSLSHVWSGCIAFRKNLSSRNLIREWKEITDINFNRNQITKFYNYKNFKWHSQEQSTLSIIYYLWKYNFFKRNLIKTIYTPIYRQIKMKWSIIEILKFYKFKFLFFLKVSPLKVFFERLRLLKIIIYK